MMVSVFFSYSHKDEALRDELEIHLSNLKRQEVISTWHDRRIGAGKELDRKINEHLETDEIILLLVSPDFIASDYCYDTEMMKAMERHDRGEARVIPVILRPCDWHGTPFGKLLAVPKDGRPVTKYPTTDDAFLQVTQEIRKAAEEMGEHLPDGLSQVTKPSEMQMKTKAVPDIRSSNLRIEKAFTDRDKDRFLSEAFKYVATYFEGSLKELAARNPEAEGDFRRMDANHFTAAIYIGGSEANHCKIWLAGRQSFTGGIAYSVGDISSDNSYNESLSVEEDGYMMFLKPLGQAFYGSKEKEKMTFEGAAEYLWGMFIEPLQR